ncbi:MAG: helix-turn-helix domain-containing protein [Azonexus sp.]|jgi:AraC family transcriptional activator of pobA|uniref:helix-turn-helix domain-containing protein n=1 Tax=Azonexus sp. TaxID=1872668 RepID=UPI00281F161D|nr:helix-turn-helix domain-containing protein [Azonexus sp.]MDR0777422.1 helix-turn-helix domain-containing protein [Azonexus sp.]
MPTTIPTYALYGDQAQPAWLDMIHFERIQVRSSFYDYDIKPHIHEGLIQLLYVTTGGGTAVIDGVAWPVRPQTLIVAPSHHVHELHFTPDVDGPVVTAAQRPLESIAKAAAPDVLPHIRQPLVLSVADSARHAEALMPLFDAIERETRLHTSGEVTAGTALLMAVFVQIARLATMLRGNTGDQGPEAMMRSRKAVQVERFRMLVDQQFHTHWPVERYASELGLTAGHLSRLCRELLGRSSLEIINARIVHEAERELVYSALGIKQIAGLLGYTDDAYFGRFFRKQTGRTPTEFRQAARKQLAPQDAVRRRRKA